MTLPKNGGFQRIWEAETVSAESNQPQIVTGSWHSTARDASRGAAWGAVGSSRGAGRGYSYSMGITTGITMGNSVSYGPLMVMNGN